MLNTTFEIRPLTENFGAEIKGVKLSGDLSTGDLNQLKAFWNRYEILLFRDQDLSKDDIVKFSRLLGELEIHVREEWLNETHPEILQISNINVDGKPLGALANGEVGWHYDQIYLPRPAQGSLLCSVKVPPERGCTFFADMTTAYERLPRDLKDIVDGRLAVQSYSNFNNMYSTKTNNKQTNLTEDIVQPLVRTHPVTGRKALYMCPGMTIQICGLPEDENREVLDHLFDWSVRDEFVYKHQWNLGDALLWDNACTMHRREPFDSNHERLMYRTTILPAPERAVPF
jgi:taurine dioxygenase